MASGESHPPGAEIRADAHVDHPTPDRQRGTGTRRPAADAGQATTLLPILEPVADDSAFIWDRGEPRRRSGTARGPKPEPRSPAVEFGGRITLREAESRFGVPVTRLRSWARDGSINGVMGSGPNGGRMWLVTPESVAHHLSRTARAPAPEPVGRTGPTADGAAMLVPRDAWDRLMDQLGNLHDAGIQLAEARERAARAETEASFLRERLAELRTERDELKQQAEPPARPAASAAGPRTAADHLKEAYRKFLGRS